MDLKIGIHIRYMQLEEPNDSFYYIIASSGTQIKYMWSDGTWNDCCFSPLQDIDNDGLYKGHFATQELALECIKKYTLFKTIYDHEGKEILIY